MNKKLEELMNIESADFMKRVQNHYQNLVDKRIEDNKMIVICCETKKVMINDEKWIKYKFKKPYHNLTHGYSPEVYKKKMEQIKCMFPNIEDD